MDLCLLVMNEWRKEGRKEGMCIYIPHIHIVWVWVPVIKAIGYLNINLWKRRKLYGRLSSSLSKPKLLFDNDCTAIFIWVFPVHCGNNKKDFGFRVWSRENMVMILVRKRSVVMRGLCKFLRNWYLIDKCRSGRRKRARAQSSQKRSVIAIEVNGTPTAIKGTLSKKRTYLSICKRGGFSPDNLAFTQVYVFRQTRS